MSKSVVKEHGAFSWNELLTTNVPAAKEFYRAALGWELQELEANPGYTVVKNGDRDIAGIMAMPKGAQGTPHWGAYVTVDDVDARVERVKSLGGKLHIAPQDIPNVGRFAVVSDPQGAMFAMITYSN